ncbi:MAG TPA: DoxX family membrane protein [Ligilactobacillus acidipiscis]|uniref:DoxX family membrane protein n=1 Tax=Ligilactobacillus acidipiscis TaxID=89059 RepID=A0A921FCP7_9LACO|nr:DoxX family membrane protein [Ligilactobacillus acidipiscis]
MGNWLRSSKSGLVIVTIVRIFAGAEWLIAGLSKFSGSFTAKSFVQRAIDHPVQDDFGREAYPWFTSFLKTIVQPQIGLFDFLVQYGELLIGLGLLLGTLTTAANFFGMALNLIYLLAGSISTNPLLLLLEIIILFAGTNRFKIGLDYWLNPYLRRKLPFLDRKKKKHELHFY